MSVTSARFGFSGLARILVQEGLLTDADAQQAVEKAGKAKQPFATYLVENNLVKARQIATAASQGFGVPLFDLNCIVTDMIPAPDPKTEKLVRQHRALPVFKRGNRLFVAVSDPTNLQALDDIKFATGSLTEMVLVEEDKLAKLIETALEGEDTSLSDLADDTDLENLETLAGDELQRDDEADSDVEDAPVVRFVNKMLLDAIKKGASDIHFEPYEKNYRVRYRMDGNLYEVAAPPVILAGKIAARIKVMSRLNVAEKRVPQDGRVKMKISANRAIDFRVSLCPTLFGEKAVLRILDPSSAKLGIDALGYEPDQKKALMDAISKPYGMVLITGPTGSGKTVSLYTCINILNQPDVNISTVEDPVEINLAGVNQVNVNPDIGMSFAAGLKAFLRQDPDIILVGEIRDQETAEIAVKAAQTGHLVLATLHTNDAPQTLTRLANIGIPPYNIAASVLLIVAQRLARRLCQHCKKPEEVPREALLKEGFTEEDLKSKFTMYAAGPGCDNCRSGYKGRLGLYQVMPISEEMGRLIMQGANSYQLGDQAKKEGVRDLRRSGLIKVMSGITSLEEINSVTKD